MRKKYIVKKANRDSDFWEDNWLKTNLEDAVRFCAQSPVRPVLDMHFPRNGKILEGGCGPGYFVIYYKQKGYDIEGVDFAHEAIKRTLSIYPDMPLKEGNVFNLDYPDNYFNAYYSGGVVEHFEEGPFKALKEARRVLCNDGMFIVSVPYVNLCRRIHKFFVSILRRKKYSNIFYDFDGLKSIYSVRKKHEVEKPPLSDFSFHQYEYGKNEFAGILKEAGFEIVRVMPFSVIWGLKECSLARNVLNKKLNLSEVKVSGSKGCAKQGFVRGFIKKLIVNEDRSSIFMKFFAVILAGLFGNMVLFVCKVKK